MSSTSNKIKYRQLQSMAKELNLPGNLKYSVLFEIVQARKAGNEQIVRNIMAEQKIERAKRRSEKLEAREAAYKHLNIFQEPKVESSSQSSISQTPRHRTTAEQSMNQQNSRLDNYLTRLLAMPLDQLRAYRIRYDNITQKRQAKRAKEQLRSQRALFNNQTITQIPVQQQTLPESYSDNFTVQEEAQDNRYINYQYQDHSDVACYEVVDSSGSSRGHSHQVPELSHDNSATASSSYLPSISNFNNGTQHFLPEGSYFQTVYQPNTQEVYYSHDLSTAGQEQYYKYNTTPGIDSGYTSGSQIMDQCNASSTPNSDTMSATEPNFDQFFYSVQSESTPNYKTESLYHHSLVYNYDPPQNNFGNYYQRCDESQVIVEGEVSDEVQDYSVSSQPASDPLQICSMNSDLPQKEPVIVEQLLYEEIETMGFDVPVGESRIEIVCDGIEEKSQELGDFDPLQ